MRTIGKYLVADDRENIGNFSDVHNWQLGSVLWGLSEHLTLLNIFKPLDKLIKSNHNPIIKKKRKPNPQDAHKAILRRRFTVVT